MATGGPNILECSACGTKFRMTPAQRLALPGNAWACKQCGHTNGSVFRPPPLPPSAMPTVVPAPFNPLAGRPRRRPWVRWIAAVLLLSAVGYGVFAVATGSRPLNAVGKLVPGLDVDPDRAAVRAWLAENLNDPEFDEVRWWPAVESTEWRDRDIEQAKQEHFYALASMRRYKQDLEKLEAAPLDPRTSYREQSCKDGIASCEQEVRKLDAYIQKRQRDLPVRFLRVKYRTKLNGGKVLADVLFVIAKGRAELATGDEHRDVYHNGRKYFPDDPSEKPPVP